MLPEPPAPPRKRHLTRWFIALLIATFGWSGWRAYTYRAALAQAKALGGVAEYTDPVETIWKNWKAAFKKETWLDGVSYLRISTRESFEQNLSVAHRLNPRTLEIFDASTFRDLAALKPLTRLETMMLYRCTGLTDVDGLKDLPSLKMVVLAGCTRLTNVDALKNLPALKEVYLIDCRRLTNVDALNNLSTLQRVSLDRCTGLTNVDALKSLPALREVNLTGCIELTPESVAALRAALPNTRIIGP